MAGPVKAVDGNIGSGRFLSGPLDPNVSNEVIVLAITTIVLPAGTILGRVDYGAQAVAVPVATAGNTGDGAFAAQPTADANIAAGDYKVVIDVEAADGGEFQVYDPAGVRVGPRGAIGVAYNGPLNFTLNDGAADFDVGDSFTITVSYAAGSGQYKPFNPAAVDGTQNAVGILYHDAPISTGTQKNVGVMRTALVNGNLITWAVAATTDQKNAAIAALALKGIIIRP